ncbi:hypothetical protein BZB76_0537 [Actinomadura pelletieri DSM 43383]|uniref:Subtilisin inhibitor-like n=1 Tax=Actinomadura pelletieri DSM 43383 TaxID=1120940 RepID=A0A495QYU7_9ACTN|nr:hypothetical protein [Actinomadura pelletieri]RKS79096.1 hypothetical protein BZB76_0537 [Actinomadura pelletieri DSM 43383]
MKARKFALSTLGVGAAALGLYGLGIGPALADEDKPKPPPITCSLDSKVGPFVAATCMGAGAVQLTVLCPEDHYTDSTINAFKGRSTLLDNRCEDGPTFAALTLFDMSKRQAGETLVPMQRVA